MATTTPRRLDDITSDWLTDVLRSEGDTRKLRARTLLLECMQTYLESELPALERAARERDEDAAEARRLEEHSELPFIASMKTSGPQVGLSSVQAKQLLEV